MATSRRFGSVLLALLVAAGAVAGWSPPTGSAQGGGVTGIDGAVSLDLAQEPFGIVGLVDLTGFVTRDPNYVQGDSFIVGWIDHQTGRYRVDLPFSPSAPLNDLTHGQSAGPGVAVFSVDFVVNVVGDERLGPWDFAGWAWGDSSIITAHGTHEVVGGQVVLWAPDDQQLAPTDFGPDGRLFTTDDPLGPVAAGWSLIDLDQRPFARIREEHVEVAIRPGSFAPLDLTQLSATAAFDELIEVLRARYPFGEDIPIDWDAVRATYRPEFEAAEQSGERADFWVALNHLLIALDDWGYFSIYPWQENYLPRFLGSAGLNARIADDGSVIVVNVLPKLPADLAGVKPGAVIVSWDGLPGPRAADAVPQVWAESSPQGKLWHKERWFGRAPVGAVIPIEFRNPGDAQPQSATLTAVEVPDENVQFSAACYRTALRCLEFESVVRVEVLPSKIAYVRISTFGGDGRSRQLLTQGWEQALTALAFSDVRGMIVDVRLSGPYSFSATPLYLAGSFFTEPFPLADLTSVDTTGAPVKVLTMTVLPSPVPWNRPVAILVDEWCRGACELFVQAMTHKPDALIVGMSATGGFLGIQMESILLPSDNFVGMVDHAFRDPATGALLVQGKGIEPTLRVPRTAETLVAETTGDPVRDAAERALLEQANAP